MKLFLTFVLLSALSVYQSHSQICSNHTEVQIVCWKIENLRWWTIGSQLTCFGGEAINSTFSDSSVSSVLHNDKSKVTNLAQITGLEIRERTVKFIPSGLKSHFINLKALSIYSCGLLSVDKENLREFGTALEFLTLSYNKLISIDADLFEYNPNLKHIYLHGNPIRHIDPEFFNNLKQLQKIILVALEPANCMNQDFETSDGHNIATFKWNNENCTNPIAKVETQVWISENSQCLHLNDPKNVASFKTLDIKKLVTSIYAQNDETKTLIAITNENFDQLKNLLTNLDKKFNSEIIKIRAEMRQSIDDIKLLMKKDKK